MLALPEQYLAAGKILGDWTHVLLLTHERPDGDALGSLVGLSRLLGAAGKTISAVCFDPPPPRFSRLLRHADLVVQTGAELARAAEKCDGIVIADTCSLTQLAPAATILQARSVPVLAIDHHVTRDRIADCYVVDESASSACLLVAELAEALGWPIDPQTAEALFSGMATDTGWFRFSNTDSRTLNAAGKLLDLGVKPHELYEEYYLSDTPARSRLMGAVLSDLELYADDRLAVMCITPEMLQRCGATRMDTQELINEAMRIGSVESVILVSAPEGDQVKVSLRSKQQIDCAALAAGFGGGGHERAAGLRIRGDQPTAKKRVMDAVLKELGAPS